MVLICLITKWTSSTTNFMYKNKRWRRKWWWDRVKKLKDRKSNGKNYILTILTRLGMFKSHKLPLKKKRGFKIFPFFSNLTFFFLSLSHMSSLSSSSFKLTFFPHIKFIFCTPATLFSPLWCHNVTEL